jgi:hypothetical protein
MSNALLRIEAVALQLQLAKHRSAAFTPLSPFDSQRGPIVKGCAIQRYSVSTLKRRERRAPQPDSRQ